LRKYSVFSTTGQSKADLNQMWLFCLGPLVLSLSNDFRLFDFPIFSFLIVPNECYCRNTH